MTISCHLSQSWGKVCVSNGYLKLLPECKLWDKKACWLLVSLSHVTFSSGIFMPREWMTRMAVVSWEAVSACHWTTACRCHQLLKSAIAPCWSRTLSQAPEKIMGTDVNGKFSWIHSWSFLSVSQVYDNVLTCSLSHLSREIPISKRIRASAMRPMSQEALTAARSLHGKAIAGVTPSASLTLSIPFRSWGCEFWISNRFYNRVTAAMWSFARGGPAYASVRGWVGGTWDLTTPRASPTTLGTQVAWGLKNPLMELNFCNQWWFIG